MAFHDIQFPLRLSLATSGGPVRRTDIVNLSNGREARNRRWRDSRRVYDVGSGLRSVADLYAVIQFFEARGGALHGFRFRDPVDWRSAAPGVPVTPLDQKLGEGDGQRTGFQLVKRYGDIAGEWARTIVKPVQASVRVAVSGSPKTAGTHYRLDAATGLVGFLAGNVPPPGAIVTAGFEFDVPVRFATDRLEISLQAFEAGRIPTIPLMEIVP